MTLRRCLDCPALCPGPRCPPCTKARERQRGTRQQRGYDKQHDQARAHMVAHLPLPCAYCPELVTTPHTLAAAHVIDGDPTAGWQPAHRTCNEHAKARPYG